MRASVVVVGGGLAGLTAACRLRARGCEVTVLEAAQGPGGRAAGGEHEGYRWDGGGHAASARDAGLVALIAEAGLSGELLPLRPERLLQVSGSQAVPIDPARTLGIARSPGVRWRDALRLRRLPRLLRKFETLLDPADPLRATRLDDRSVADFVRLYFGASALEHWAAPLLIGDALADPIETSRLLFILHHLSRNEAPVGLLRGSFRELANRLTRPSDRFGARVRTLEAAGQGFRVAFEHEGSEQTMEPDGVVLATPAETVIPLAGPLLVDAERRIFEASRSLPALVLVAGLEGSFAEKASRYRFRPEERRPVVSMAVEPGGAWSTAAPEGCERAVLMASAEWSAAHFDAPDDVVAKTLAGSLGRVLPGAPAAMCFSRVLRHRRAFPRFDVGRYRELSRLRDVSADRLAHGRRLVFAGDYRIAPTIEGAVVSGGQAADELAAAFGLSR
ncbi:MAG: FAD-dependent oxidoreductase [Deltaproteobacteria bacterium]|nr:FAD-dependent oxidoreductase [Deltaproteobacteria bacterium]MBW2395351.1 FAD-dependent oxidoreductase [Deltaproteobacteria bacterium]